jgi:hypothetical protein
VSRVEEGAEVVLGLELEPVAEVDVAVSDVELVSDGVSLDRSSFGLTSPLSHDQTQATSGSRRRGELMR